jgi:hypothetical protein
MTDPRNIDDGCETLVAAVKWPVAQLLMDKLVMDTQIYELRRRLRPVDN